MLKIKYKNKTVFHKVEKKKTEKERKISRKKND